MLDLMPSLNDWRPAASGQRFAVATVVGAAGSVPRPVGTSMLVSESGEVLGSLSGGCVEAAVVESALQAMHDGGARLESFGYSAEDAFAVGLTCGGDLEVHIDPLGRGDAGLQWQKMRDLSARLSTRGSSAAMALIRRVDPTVGFDPTVRGDAQMDPAMGNTVVISDPATFSVANSSEIRALLGLGNPATGKTLADTANTAAMLAAAAQLEPLLRGGRTGLVRLAPANRCSSAAVGSGAVGSGAVGSGAVGGSTEDAAESMPGPVTLLVESRLPPARMLVFGANDFSAALLPAGKLLGYQVTLCDARPAFAGQDRFTGADEVITDWPHRYLAAEAAAGRIDSRTVICVLTHDPKFDVPLLATALTLDVAYVGAMGSRQSHRRRVESLLAEGVSRKSLAALHSPIGLDLGAVTPAEVAVSITAELVASLNRSGQPGIAPLKDGSGPIHLHAATPAAARVRQSKDARWT